MMTITGYEHEYHMEGKKRLLTSDVWTIDENGVKRRFTVTAVAGNHKHEDLIANAEKACREGIERVNNPPKEAPNG